VGLEAPLLHQTPFEISLAGVAFVGFELQSFSLQAVHWTVVWRDGCPVRRESERKIEETGRPVGVDQLTGPVP
jgi:hypothetical protein